MTPQQRLIHFERGKIIDYLKSIAKDSSTPTEVRQYLDRVSKEIEQAKHRVGV